MKKKASLWEVLVAFMKISCFTFGGGYAMLGVIQHTAVEVKKWITNDEMMDVVVIAESTPGPIAINCATYVGYKQGGVLGAIMATLGIIIPPFVIIYAISMFLENFLEITFIANAFKGINAAVGLLIIDAGLKMIKKMPKTRITMTIMIVSAALILLTNLFSWGISSIMLMIVAGLVGLVVFREKAAEKGGEAQ
ncbi:MAG: chromate transporter [Clostridia bacterium]|nr:chromate transporter [Clostridia bacterium]